MARNWEAKGAAEAVERRWRVPLRFGEAISSVSVSATGVTATASHEYEEAIADITGGTAGTTGTVTLTVVTTEQTLIETFYIPVRVATVLRTTTVRDVVSFALMKVTGDGEDPSADQEATGISILSELLALYRLTGVDLGISGALTASDTLSIPDDLLAALKWVLRGHLYAHYGADMSQFDMKMADGGERALVNAAFKGGDLNMPSTLSNSVNWVAGLF